VDEFDGGEKGTLRIGEKGWFEAKTKQLLEATREYHEEHMNNLGDDGMESGAKNNGPLPPEAAKLIRVARQWQLSNNTHGAWKGASFYARALQAVEKSNCADEYKYPLQFEFASCLHQKWRLWEQGLDKFTSKDIKDLVDSSSAALTTGYPVSGWDDDDAKNFPLARSSLHFWRGCAYEMQGDLRRGLHDLTQAAEFVNKATEIGAVKRAQDQLKTALATVTVDDPKNPTDEEKEALLAARHTLKSHILSALQIIDEKMLDGLQEWKEEDISKEERDALKAEKKWPKVSVLERVEKKGAEKADALKAEFEKAIKSKSKDDMQLCVAKAEFFPGLEKYAKDQWAKFKIDNNIKDTRGIASRFKIMASVSANPFN